VSKWASEHRRLKYAVEGCFNGVWGDEPNGVDDLVVVRVADFNRERATVELGDSPTIRAIPSGARNRRLLRKGDLLIEKSGGGEQQPVGNVVLFQHEVPAVCSNFVARLPVADGCDPRYVAYLFRALYTEGKNVPHIKQTSGIQNLDSESYLNELAWLPSRDTQAAIANFLDQQTAGIDALIAEKKRLVERLQELKRAQLGQLAVGLDSGRPLKETGHPALPLIPRSWTLSRLKWVCSLLRDGTHQPPPRVDEGVPLLSVRNVQEGNFTFLPDDSFISEEHFLELNRSFDVRQGDVLLAVVGATMGKVAVVPAMGRTFHIQRSLAVARPRLDLTMSELLAAQMRSEYFQQLLWQNTGFSAQPGIYLGALGDFPIPIPPEEERGQIVAALSERASKVDTLVHHVRGHLHRLTEYRSSLISAAVTGQLNISEYKEAA